MSSHAPVNDSGVFAALGTSLAEFRQAAEGEPGSKVMSMGAQPGDIPDLIRAAVGGIAEVLIWLQRAADEARPHVLVADSALALLQVGSDVIVSMPPALGLGEAQGPLRVDPAAVRSIDTALQTGKQAVIRIEKLADSIVPSVEELDRVRAELSAMLGDRTGTQAPGSGSLRRLLTAIGNNQVSR